MVKIYLVWLLFVILLCSLLALGAFWLDKESCVARGEKMGYKVEYTILTGCMWWDGYRWF